MKLNQVKVHCIDAATPAALDTAVNNWLVTTGEATFLSILYSTNGGDFSVLITYTK
jgi:hypothetical protein